MTPEFEAMAMARKASRAAGRANIIAVAALIIAVIAIAVSVIPLFIDQTDPLSAAVRVEASSETVIAPANLGSAVVLVTTLLMVMVE